MVEYIIKTDKKDKKTHILRAGTPTVRLGIVYTDLICPQKQEKYQQKKLLTQKQTRQLQKLDCLIMEMLYPLIQSEKNYLR